MEFNHRAIGFVAASIWLLMFAISSTGLYTVDELIYMISIDTFAETGRLIIENGYQQFHADALQMWFLPEGPHGLATQYPSGYAIVAYPFYLLGGIRGVMLMNTTAAIALLYVTYRLAMEMYEDRRIAIMSAILLFLCSFLVDYALVIWPHALASLTVMSSLLLFVLASKVDGPQHYWFALCSGSTLSIGLLFRVDVILVLPAMALWSAYYHQRTIKFLALFSLGMLPLTFFVSYLNYIKFGIFIPISYGPSNGGGTDVPNYITLGFCYLLLFLFTLYLKHYPQHRYKLLNVAALIGIALLFIPFIRSELVGIVKGFYVLGIDLREYSGDRMGFGVEGSDAGYVTFHGVAKKALAQSLPWVGLIFVLFLSRCNVHDKRMHLLNLAVIVLLITPFAIIEWYGGFSNNMRYLLSTLPLFSILTSYAWHRHITPEGKEVNNDNIFKYLAVGFTIYYIIVISAALTIEEPHRYLYLFEQHLPWLLFLSLISAIIVNKISSPDATWAVHLTRTIFAISLIHGFVTSYFLDLTKSQLKRGASQFTENIYRSIPDNSLVYAHVLAANLPLAMRDDTFLAFPLLEDRSLDTQLVVDALNSGRRVFVESTKLTQQLVSHSDIITAKSYIFIEPVEIWEIVLAHKYTQNTQNTQNTEQ